MILLWMDFYWLEVEIKNNGVLTASGHVAHKADFGMKTLAVQNADGGNFQVIY